MKPSSRNLVVNNSRLLKTGLNHYFTSNHFEAMVDALDQAKVDLIRETTGSIATRNDSYKHLLEEIKKKRLEIKQI